MSKIAALRALAARQELRHGLAVSAGLLGAAAHAEGTSVDVSSITAAVATVGTVGAAVFAVYVAVRVFKWVRSSL